MALKGRDLVLAGLASFVAWGYATHWFPSIRFAGYAFIAGVVVTLLGLLGLVTLSSRGSAHRPTWSTSRPHAAAFLARGDWQREVAALRGGQVYEKSSLYADSPKISRALDDLLELVTRDFVCSWY